MSSLEAIILGIIQGLTEYLPVSSSGHLAIGTSIFGIDAKESLSFTIVVHMATVCSTLCILWKEINWLIVGIFSKHFNEEKKYMINILVSMIPIAIVGLFFKDIIEQIFGSGLLIVGIMLLITSLLITLSYYYKHSEKKNISMLDAFIIGVAQAIAVMPGLSRSGSTIATGLLLGNDKSKLAQFSFLMVIPPIMGEALLDAIKMFNSNIEVSSANSQSLIIGFISAFIAGCIACKFMINIVKKGKLIYFGIYCALIGLSVLIYSLFIQ